MKKTRLQLKKIVNHAQKNSAFYQKRFKGFQVSDLNDFRKLPLLKCLDVVENYKKIVCVPFSKILKIGTSSSSSGTYKLIPMTRKDIKQLAMHLADALKMFNLKKGDYIIPMFWFGPSIGGQEVQMALDILNIPSTPVSLYTPNLLLGLMSKIRPTILFGVPSSILSLGQNNKSFFKEHRFRKIILGGELVTHTLKVELKRLFNADEVVQIYGATEVGPIGISYDECDALHFIGQNYVFTEILDPLTLKEVRDEEAGTLVLTTLANKTFPFIRYQVDDIVLKTNCSCGRKNAFKILGRTGKNFIVGSVMIFPQVIYESCEKFFIRTGMKITEVDIIIRKNDTNRDLIESHIAVESIKHGVDLKELFIKELADQDDDIGLAIKSGMIIIENPKIKTKQSLSHKVTLNIKDLR